MVTEHSGDILNIGAKIFIRNPKTNVLLSKSYMTLWNRSCVFMSKERGYSEGCCILCTLLWPVQPFMIHVCKGVFFFLHSKIRLDALLILHCRPFSFTQLSLNFPFQKIVNQLHWFCKWTHMVSAYVNCLFPYNC